MTDTSEEKNEKAAARSEEQIFEDLTALCAEPGFIHVLSYFNMTDNMIIYDEELKPDDMTQYHKEPVFIRTEQNVLLGLLIKNNIDFTIPAPEDFDAMGNKAIALMEELHRAMSPTLSDLTKDDAAGLEAGMDLLSSGAFLREAIFYGCESALSSQYRDFLPAKYGRDDSWLKVNRDFVISQGVEVLLAVRKLAEDKVVANNEAMKKLPPEQWTTLPALQFSADEVAAYSNLPGKDVEQVLEAFALPAGECNHEYQKVQDFNRVVAFPLLRRGSDYILFNVYSLAEALYQSPFYWMWDDKSYRPTAMTHRGQFTEEFAYDRLVAVFGKENVHLNVIMSRSKGVIDGEIDVLVFYAGLALVLQAKSKQLTILARQGNEAQLHSDFSKAVQDSCDQGFSCSDLLFDPGIKLFGKDDVEIQIPVDLKKGYVICVVADHYPALSYQTRQFLQAVPSDRVAPPFVMDVFLLDTMAEMLDTPLHFLSYIDRRTGYDDKLMSSHELNLLGFHIKYNLWIDGEYDLFMMHDDFSTELDLSMMVRRENYPGPRTPEGMLTRYAETSLGRLAHQLGSKNEAAMMELGFLILKLGEDTVMNISRAIDHFSRLAVQDGKHHDFAMPMDDDDAGLAVHMSMDPMESARTRLGSHCLKRKYVQKVSRWFGICLNPHNGEPRFAVKYDFKWERDPAMDEVVKNMKGFSRFDSQEFQNATSPQKNDQNEHG